MSTTNIVKSVEPSFGAPFDIVLTLSKTKPLKENINTVPITVHISTEPNADLGCYVYSIVDTRTPSENPQIYQTLLNNASETLVDLGKRLGQLVSKKYLVPSYVSLSGQVSMQDFMGLIQETFALIEENWKINND
ncbi:hypothetical protein OGAPHI_004456 [Ogataea philodendri]|uniref:Uncharacterized protein n=1 Tax=Ogataea philodendri TaxID=1378263 RepID=A0A9P8P7J2_9ASCO|nr:uncharacterized protein OGAPHI_004456 [Ogataea philodendri]KAH3666267.1 hypothetical protein OGAPHI_004456 [Ogataea philodendri]